MLAFQCRNPIHRAHYELFIRALDAPNVRGDGVCLVHPTCGPTQVRPWEGGVEQEPGAKADCKLGAHASRCVACASPDPPPQMECVVSRLTPLTLPTAGSQDDDIPGVVRYRTYEVLKEEAANPRLRWAYLPYSMHMAGPREAIQHMIIRKNYGGGGEVLAGVSGLSPIGSCRMASWRMHGSPCRQTPMHVS